MASSTRTGVHRTAASQLLADLPGSESVSSEIPLFDSLSPWWRAPRQFRMRITRDIAALMLDSNPRNRPISWRKVNDYAREMEAGNWKFNPADSICFDPTGYLQNGQHRLLAVFDTGLAQEFAVATDVPMEVQDVMDSGLKRSTAHQLALSGYVDAKTIAAIARIFLLWEGGTIASSLRSSSTPDVRRWVEASDPVALEFSIVQAKRVSSLFSLRSGIVGAAAFAAYTKDPAAAKQFFEDLCEGVGLDKVHPVLTLRNYLTRQGQLKTKFAQQHQLWLLVSTWNTWRRGGTLVKIMSPSEWTSSNFPVMK